jgi:hypothetical protein
VSLILASTIIAFGRQSRRWYIVTAIIALVVGLGIWFAEVVLLNDRERSAVGLNVILAVVATGVGLTLTLQLNRIETCSRGFIAGVAFMAMAISTPVAFFCLLAVACFLSRVCI